MISFMAKILLTILAVLGLMVSTRWSTSAPYVLIAYAGLGVGVGWSFRRLVDHLKKN